MKIDSIFIYILENVKIYTGKQRCLFFFIGEYISLFFFGWLIYSVRIFVCTVTLLLQLSGHLSSCIISCFENIDFCLVVSMVSLWSKRELNKDAYMWLKRQLKLKLFSQIRLNYFITSEVFYLLIEEKYLLFVSCSWCFVLLVTLKYRVNKKQICLFFWVTFYAFL